MHWGVRPQRCPAASCGDSRRTKGALGENWLAVATWWLFIVILDILASIPCMTEIKHPTLQMGQFKQLGSFTEVSFLETCEAHAGWKQTWHSRDRGFWQVNHLLSLWIWSKLSWQMLVFALMLSQTSKFSRTPTKCFAYERVSSLISMSKRTYSWFSTYFLHIFYFWPVIFPTFFPKCAVVLLRISRANLLDNWHVFNSHRGVI